MPTKPYMTQAEVDRAKRLREMGFTYPEIAERLGRSHEGIYRLAKRGWKIHDHLRLPCPPEFKALRQRMTVRQLAEHYDTGHHQIVRWSRECGFTRDEFTRKGHVSHRRRPCPPDFAELFPKLGYIKACKHWRCSNDVIARWKAECGLELPVRRRIESKKAKAPANDAIAPPPGYDAFKRKLPPVRHIYGEAA